MVWLVLEDQYEPVQIQDLPAAVNTSLSVGELGKSIAGISIQSPPVFLHQ